MKNGFPFTINMKVNTKPFADSMKKAKSAAERMREAMKEEKKVEFKSNVRIEYTTPEKDRNPAIYDEPPIFWNHNPDDIIGKISDKSVLKMEQDVNKRETSSNFTGLTEDEESVTKLITDAYEAFIALPVQHPDEQRDFCDGVHRLQDLMACRVVRRDYPAFWRTVKN